MNNEFYIKFWGVRGTVPVVNKSFKKYGGNTSCVEVRCNGRQIILDAGTGIRPLGLTMDICDVDILLSHTHLDHIQGLPFFNPLHCKGSNVALWAGNLLPEHTLEKILHKIMTPPVFPLAMGDVYSSVEFNDFVAGNNLESEKFSEAGITIKTIPLNHPDGATGYRIEYLGKTACYITDVEHIPGKISQELVNFVKDADVLIYDSTYDDKDFHIYQGWGHSTWQECLRIGKAANVRKIIAFHHNPDANDDALNQQAIAIKGISPNAILAMEGMEINMLEVL